MSTLYTQAVRDVAHCDAKYNNWVTVAVATDKIMKFETFLLKILAYRIGQCLIVQITPSVAEFEIPLKLPILGLCSRLCSRKAPEWC